jgi:hypothetical protein
VPDPNPNTRIALLIDVYHDETTHRVTANLHFHNPGSGKVVLTSTMRDVESDGQRLFNEKIADTQNVEMWASDPLEGEPPIKDPRGAVIATFELPDDSFSMPSVTAVQARLPAIAPNEWGLGTEYPSPLVWAGDGYHAYPDVPSDNPTVSVFDKPRQYSVPSGAKVVALYWEPETLVTTEVLDDVADFIPLDTIQLNSPSTGNVQGQDFVWTGSFGLSAALLATNRGLEQRHLRNDFLSGVFLATSVAALIALIQETPDAWPWRWRRRPRTRKSAEEIDVEPPTPPHQAVKDRHPPDPEPRDP